MWIPIGMCAEMGRAAVIPELWVLKMGKNDSKCHWGLSHPEGTSWIILQVGWVSWDPAQGSLCTLRTGIEGRPGIKWLWQNENEVTALCIPFSHFTWGRWVDSGSDFSKPSPADPDLQLTLWSGSQGVLVLVPCHQQKNVLQPLAPTLVPSLPWVGWSALINSLWT